MSDNLRIELNRYGRYHVMDGKDEVSEAFDNESDANDALDAIRADEAEEVRMNKVCADRERFRVLLLRATMFLDDDDPDATELAAEIRAALA